MDRMMAFQKIFVSKALDFFLEVVFTLFGITYIDLKLYVFTSGHQPLALPFLSVQLALSNCCFDVAATYRGFRNNSLMMAILSVDTAGAGMNSLRKETMDVLMEVAYLINRLEADRQDAKEALQRERQTNERLGSKMDSLAVWRQQEFPAVVQRGECDVSI